MSGLTVQESDLLSAVFTSMYPEINFCSAGPEWMTRSKSTLFYAALAPFYAESQLLQQISTKAFLLLQPTVELP